jgi:hypothetical protein
MEIIIDCGLRKFGALIALEDFAETLQNISHPGASFANAFAFGGVLSADAFYAYAEREGAARNIRCVFEKGDPEESIRRAFRASGYNDPDFTWKVPRIDRKGVTHDPFIGLQAAGWIAYEYYLAHARDLVSDGKPLSPRWAFAEFEKLPGHIRPIQYGCGSHTGH